QAASATKLIQTNNETLRHRLASCNRHRTIINLPRSHWLSTLGRNDCVHHRLKTLGRLVDTHDGDQHLAHTAVVFCVGYGRVLSHAKTQLETTDYRTCTTHFAAVRVRHVCHCADTPVDTALPFQHIVNLHVGSRSP